MADEYFYGITLSGAGATEVWDPETKAEEYPRTNKLVLRQALLGHEAKEGEYNVVQVETMSIRDTVKTPVAVLKVGESRQCRLDLEFPDYPVTFTLIQGSGPVHLHGQHLFGALVEEFEDMDEMEEELLDEEEDEDQADGPKKRKSGNKREHEDEDQEEEDGPKKKAKLANNAKGKAGAPKNKKK
ncbi:nucleoplasmin-like protein isoform X1 [Ctenocephalides felis]|uniref:nucleoplasmin-like protein isoform X1 n=1 Tax=Ctenocephalides felis TaxID=7515 RepID=UPI000E6E586A|nr:nucleoplasmin-like protein isoform X1 [Ctenocephalides felis]XP_026462312.1 nucleoplasmin-like protein isoform X1 [Ctenocephalides felis]